VIDSCRYLKQRAVKGPQEVMSAAVNSEGA